MNNLRASSESCIFIENDPPPFTEYVLLRASVNWPLHQAENDGSFLTRIKYSVTARDKSNGELVGFGSVHFQGHFFEFYDLMTKPEYQQKGIGRRITELIIAWCQQRVNEQPEKWMKLFGKVAIGRESFYEQFGFVRPTQADGHNEMSLKLHNQR